MKKVILLILITLLLILNLWLFLDRNPIDITINKYYDEEPKMICEPISQGNNEFTIECERDDNYTPNR